MKYRLTWGAGETEQGTQDFDTLDAVRGMLAWDTDLSPEGIEQLIATGKSDDSANDLAYTTQFDSPWIRMETIS
jgi:hypothetical protein